MWGMCHSIDMKQTHYFELELEVDYDYQPEEDAVTSGPCMSPHIPASVEINSIRPVIVKDGQKHLGACIPEEVFEQYDLEGEVLNQRCDMHFDRDDYGDYMYEQKKDRREK